MTWRDDWPLIGEAGEPILRHAKPDLPRQPIANPQTSDEMELATGGQLSPQWQWHANHGDGWFDLRARPGWLRLRSLPLMAAERWEAAPNLLLQKLPAPSFTAETLVDLGANDAPVTAGLAVVGDSSAAVVVERDGATAGARVVLRIDQRVAYSAPIESGPVRLRVTFTEGGACTFGYAVGGAEVHGIEGAGFTARAGRWVGAQVGIFAATPAAATDSANAHADFDYFRFMPAQAPAVPEVAVTSDAAIRR